MRLDRTNFFPHGAWQKCLVHIILFSCRHFSGGNSGGVTPVPVPNTVVKASSADGTALERGWESRTSPDYFSQSPTFGWGFSFCCRYFPWARAARKTPPAGGGFRSTPAHSLGKVPLDSRFASWVGCTVYEESGHDLEGRVFRRLCRRLSFVSFLPGTKRKSCRRTSWEFSAVAWPSVGAPIQVVGNRRRREVAERRPRSSTGRE